MSETAAHLVDSVLPIQNIRQWVISFPFNVPVAINYNANTPLTPEQLSQFVSVTLQAGSQTLTQSISVANLVANQNKMTVPFMVTFQPIDVGLKTLIATVNAGNSFKELNYANNQSTQQVHVVDNKYKIVKEVTIDGVIQNSDFVSIAPSKLAGCNSKDFKYVQIKVSCVKLENNVEVPAEDCKVYSQLDWNKNIGPHNSDTHDESDAHLGTINAHPEVIPITGLVIKYVVSEFAGEYAIVLDGEDPDDNPIDETSVIVRARIQNDLTPLNLAPLNEMLVLKVLTPNNRESHPYEGYFATPLLRDRLSIALAQYRAEVNALNESMKRMPFNDAFLRDLSIPLVQSEAASLSWGGAYDIDKTWSTNGRHCLHRNGTNIDISMSPFDIGVQNEFLREKYKNELAKAFLKDRIFEFPEDDEKPDDYIDHWHARPL